MGCHQPPSLGRLAFSCGPVKNIGLPMSKRGSPPGGSGPAKKNIKEGVELPWASKTYQQAKLLSLKVFPENMLWKPFFLTIFGQLTLKVV